MYDILNEDPRPLRAAAKEHPAFRKLSGKTLTRYALTGVLKGGSRVRLDTVRVGGRLFTSAAALARFLDALNDSPGTVALPRAPSARRRASEKAAAELDRKMTGV